MSVVEKCEVETITKSTFILTDNPNRVLEGEVDRTAMHFEVAAKNENNVAVTLVEIPKLSEALFGIRPVTTPPPTQAIATENAGISLTPVMQQLAMGGTNQNLTMEDITGNRDDENPNTPVLTG